jgi:predicted kinase
MFRRPTHSAEESQKLYSQLNDVTRELLAAGRSVVFDTNFNFHKDRQHLRDIAASVDADVKLIWMTTSEDLARERALHDRHAERNGYKDSMKPATFDGIVGHLEPPTDREHPIKLDGIDLGKDTVLHALGLR